MIQLQPKERIPLIYLIGDHTDSNTYYVRSVIYDSLTRSVLETKDLTDKGNRVFLGIVYAPQDDTGHGRHIDVITTVYTDSGYTTKSEIYPQTIEKYLVQQRWMERLGGGGGGVVYDGGPDIDYKKIQRMIVEAIAGIQFPSQEKFDYGSIVKEIRGLPKPIAPKDIDFSPLAAAISQLQKSLNARPQFKESNLLPITSGLSEITNTISDLRSRTEEKFSSVAEQLSRLIVMLNEAIDFKNERATNETFKTRANEFKGKMNEFMGAFANKEPEKEPAPFLRKYMKQ